MTPKKILLFIIAWIVFSEIQADDWKGKLVRQGIAKYQQLLAYNKANTKAGKTHLNEYVIELSQDWIEERPDRVIISKNFETLSKLLRDFNDNREDNLRFYVVVVNNYEAQLDETISSENLPSQINSLEDYIKLPAVSEQYKTFKSEISTVPQEILGAMRDKGYEEQIVYFFARISLFKLAGIPLLYNYDNLALEGGRLDDVAIDEEIRSKAKSAVSGKSASKKVEQVVANLINAVQLVIDGDGSGIPSVDCSKSLDYNTSLLAPIREKEYDLEVTKVADLLDKEGQQLSVIFENPSDFEDIGLFTRQILIDKTLLLSRHSSYKLYVVFKQVNFLMPREDWAKFAKDVYNRSTLAKQSAKNIIMVVPYVHTVCTGTGWLGQFSTGAGMVMPAVYCDDAESSLRTLMNSALSLTGITWEQNFNQAFSHIPKKHYLLKYALSYDFITKRYGTVITEGPGHDEIFELQILVDERLQKHIDARRAIDQEMRKKAPLPSVLQTNEGILKNLPNERGNAYLLKHGLKESVLERLEGEGLNRYSPDAEQFVKWFTSGKAAEYAGSGWASLANTFDVSTNSPPNEKFITGVNPIVLENYLAALDVAGFVLNFAELDWIADGAGFLIASYYRDTENKIIYGASLAIPVSAIVIKTIAKRAKALKRTLNGEWQLVEDITEGLAAKLTGDLKSTYDDLLSKGINYYDDGSVIKFFDTKGEEIASIEAGKFTPKKWTSTRGVDPSLISETPEGYFLVKNGNDYSFNIGYKENRVLTAEEVNAYYKGIGKHEPYKPGTPVIERSLQPGDKVYVVENQNGGIPSPGGWGSKNKISTEKELREYLAVLEDWKKANGVSDPLVVREYTVMHSIRVRDGVIGPQKELTGKNANEIYYGGEHQYEFVDYPGNGAWKGFFNDKPVEYVLK